MKEQTGTAPAVLDGNHQQFNGDNNIARVHPGTVLIRRPNLQLAVVTPAPALSERFDPDLTQT